VLGVGFIMVAAMFPAALKQTQAAVEDATASALWIDVARKFNEMAKNKVQPAPANGAVQYLLDQTMPADGSGNSAQADSRVFTFDDKRLSGLPALQRTVLWEFARGNMLLEEDPRFAVVPLFRREADNTASNKAAAEAQLFLIAVRCRYKTAYDASDLFFKVPNTYPNLGATLFDVTVNPVKANLPDGSQPDAPWIQFRNGNTDVLGLGAYVVISDATPKNKNGQIYRLAQHALPAAPDLYYIAPDAAGAGDVYVVTPPFATYSAKALVVGRGLNPATSQYEGPVQDLAIVPVPLKLR
jgi:hypothetical protein